MNHNAIPHDLPTTTATRAADKPAPGVRHVFKLGLDVDLHYCVTAIQCDHGTLKPAQKLTRPQLLKWVREQVASGHEVHTVYEACGFGYTLHEVLVAAGAKSLVTTPMRLSPERRRKNDRLDARELCVRLARHVDGHAHELRPIRIPTAAERERRELGRQRNFWVREVRRLENHGRALRLKFEHETLPGNWAGPRTWKQLASECSAFVREQLEPVVAQIRAAQATLAQLTARVEATVNAEEVPTGLGALTVGLVEGEVCDWQRFPGRKDTKVQRRRIATMAVAFPCVLALKGNFRQEEPLAAAAPPPKGAQQAGESTFTPNAEAEWRQASLPDVEGGIPAAREKRRPAPTGRAISVRLSRVCGCFRRAGKPGSTAGKDACHYRTMNSCRRLPVAALWVDCSKRPRTTVAHGRRLKAAGTGSWRAATDQSPRIGTMNRR